MKHFLSVKNYIYIYIYILVSFFFLSLEIVNADTIIIIDTPSFPYNATQTMIYNFSTDKNIYNIGDNIFFNFYLDETSHIDEKGNSYKNFPGNFMGGFIKDGWNQGSTIGIGGVGLHTNCSTYNYSGDAYTLTTCPNSIKIPSTISVTKIYSWVNHGAPFSASETYQKDESIFKFNPNGVFIYPKIIWDDNYLKLPGIRDFFSLGGLFNPNSASYIYAAISIPITIINPNIQLAPSILVK